MFHLINSFLCCFSMEKLENLPKKEWRIFMINFFVTKKISLLKFYLSKSSGDSNSFFFRCLSRLSLAAISRLPTRTASRYRSSL